MTNPLGRAPIGAATVRERFLARRPRKLVRNAG